MRQLLGYKDEELKALTIESLMPWPIYQKHGLFIKRFNHTGQAYIINNRATMFVKKKTGFVAPTEMFIKFHHSIDYQYTFLAIMKPFYEMAPFANGLRYTMDQLLFMVVENDTEGSISEFSDSANRILKNFGVKLNSEESNVTQRIVEVLTDLDFTALRDTRNDRILSKEIYEADHTFDFTTFQENSNPYHQHVHVGDKAYKNNSGEIGVLETKQNMVRAKVRVFEERYSAGILEMNVVCVAFANQENNGGASN